MSVAGSNGRIRAVAAHCSRCMSLVRCAVAQLAEIIAAPAVRRAVGEPAGVSSSVRRNRCERDAAADERRYVATDRRTIAELPVVVEAPAVRTPGVGNAARDTVGGRETRELNAAAHRHW